ncbi:MAG: flagellar hook-basal body protein [Cellulosilyticum sp.]|nr:flagellar hook-basal body protein [Cellulosilyticum sp.]
MVRGLYTAAMGMNVQAKRLDIVSNDLANAGTTGYKKDVAVVSSFKEEYLARLNDQQNFAPNNAIIGKITYGAKIDEVYTDFTQGSVRATSSPNDLAIQGDGFFTVQTPNGLAYTRDGNFMINQFGQLVTSEGYNVMGQEGAIELGEDYFTQGNSIVVQGNGEIYLDGAYIDTLDIANFTDNRSLTKLDDNLYTSTGERGEFTGGIIQSFLETSNVNTVSAMVDMITVARAYETNQKMVQTQDSLLGKAVNELGRG